GLGAEGCARRGPAFFGPGERGGGLGYDEAGYAHGRKLAGELGFDAAVQILDAAARRLRRYLAAFNEPRGGVGTVGYCWGGTLAMLGALKLGLPSVSYYGARNTAFLDDPALVDAPRAPG